jgi:feruloyl esterase
LTQRRAKVFRPQKLTNGTVTSAAPSPRARSPSRGDAERRRAALADLPAFCRVAATLTPTKESDIKIEVWLPMAGWNGKLQAVGNGGLERQHRHERAGRRRPPRLRGHEHRHRSSGWRGPWMQNPEKVTDWAYRSVHETAVAAKALINAFYGEAPKFSYFTAARPGDGRPWLRRSATPPTSTAIVAGSPGLDWTSRAISAVRVNQAFEKIRLRRSGREVRRDQRRGHGQV